MTTDIFILDGDIFLDIFYQGEMTQPQKNHPDYKIMNLANLNNIYYTQARGDIQEI